MKTPRPFSKLLLASTAILHALALYPQGASGQTPAPLTETEQRLGVFTIGVQTYTVTARNQNISGAPNAKFAITLSELEIRDANENVVYQESFPFNIEDDHFIPKLSVTASLLEGAGGATLLLRFLEETGEAGAVESWQMFGLVNGALTLYGAPLSLGQGSGIAVGGVLTGVMLRGGIGVVPLASTAEALEFRAWAGNFFVYIPVRVDWARGQWSEGEQCFALNNGNLRPNGCNLRITANARPRADGSVALYAQPQEDRYNARQVSVRSNSAVEFLIARALVNWKNSSERFACSFEDMWLRVRIDGAEGWVHSEADFAALDLPSAGPPQ